MSDDLEEANELISELKNQIEELEQTIEDLEDDGDRYNEGFEAGEQESAIKGESKIETAFYSGHLSGFNKESSLRGFLNFKMEQRL